VTLTAFLGQRVTATAGRERAYVGDYDVDVVGSSKAADPIVLVVQTGMALDMRAVLDGAGRVHVTLEGGLCEGLGSTLSTVGAGAVVELPRVALAEIRADVSVVPGEWTRVDGRTGMALGEGWAFLVRARIERLPAGSASEGTSLPARRAPSGENGPVEMRSFEARALRSPGKPRAGPAPVVHVSNWTPPESPELPEPVAPIDPVLLRHVLVEALPDPKAAAVEFRNRSLYVRGRPDAHDAVAKTFAALEATLLWDLDVEGTLVEVPGAAPYARSPLLSPEDAAAIEAALTDGSARLVDRLAVSSRMGARNFVRVGEDRVYVTDYAVELAEGAFLGNPIVQTLSTGSVLDVEAGLDSTRTGVALNVRFTRLWEPQRTATSPTPWGEVEVPDVRVMRLRTSLWVPLGRTAVVGASSEGGRRTLLLLTPRLRGAQGASARR
jgi:hypothetical protein